MLRIYLNFTPFSDGEAWLLFRLAAFAEAVGWTLLIIGILLTEILHSHIPVALAGRTHGILFMLYITAVLALTPSLKWSWKRTIIAGLMSTPPYGSLAFELWESQTRQHTTFYTMRSVVFYHLLRKSGGSVQKRIPDCTWAN